MRDNIIVYALPPVWPLVINTAGSTGIIKKKLARYIKKKAALHGFDKPHLWCYSPTSVDIVPYLPHAGLIYDCVDRHSAYSGLINPEVVDGMERELATAADMVFCTAAGALYDTLVSYNQHTKLIPNGADYPLFAQAAQVPPPKRPPKPIFGFVGMLQDCIAYDFLLALSDAFPEGEIRLIGRVMPG